MTVSDALLAASHQAADAYLRRQNATERATQLALAACWTRNPFSRQHFNFTQQTIIAKSSPALAANLQAEARKIDRAL